MADLKSAPADSRETDMGQDVTESQISLQDRTCPVNQFAHASVESSNQRQDNVQFQFIDQQELYQDRHPKSQLRSIVRSNARRRSTLERLRRDSASKGIVGTRRTILMNVPERLVGNPFEEARDAGELHMKSDNSHIPEVVIAPNSREAGYPSTNSS
jgi:hypothetical protein